MKYIIKEERIWDTSDFFDGDWLTERGGDYGYTMFIIRDDYYGYTHHYDGVNGDEYNDLISKIDTLRDGFYDAENYSDCTYKQAMLDCGLSYNATLCHKLKKWYQLHEKVDHVTVADYLTITTGKKWITRRVNGYVQGDFVDTIFCMDFYPFEDAYAYAEIFLGCCKEFSVTYIDEDGNNDDTTYGFYIADSQVRRDEDYKLLVCADYGIDSEDTELQLITGEHTHTEYEYTIVC